MKKDFSLTHVVYDTSDLLGFPLALITLTPVYIMVMYTTLIIFRRDLHTITLLIGQMLNELLNWILKRTINQSRPKGAALYGNGMPSAHAQFTMFFAVYVLMFLVKRAKYTSLHERYIAGFGLHLLACLVAYSRVHLGYHSIAQVVVGMTVGIVVAVVWFSLVHYILAPYYFPMIENWSISRFLLIRDTTHVRDILSFEYNQIRHYRKKN